MSAFKMLAMDLDDTLLDRELKIKEKDREAIFRARQAGVVVTLATGRMYRAALPFARELEIDVPIVTYQGAYTRNPVTGEVLLHRPVPLVYALEIIDRIVPLGFHINVYLDDNLYVERHTEESRLYYQISRVEAQAVGPLGPFLEQAGQDPTKVLVVGRENLLDQLLAELKPIYDRKLHITKSKPHFLEFSHPQATKADALDAVARLYGIKPEEVIAIGDSYNDLEMIDYAGLGVVMGNAREEVQARADYVTTCLEQCGVAHAIEKFILNL